jgi:hypothetical protein
LVDIGQFQEFAAYGVEAGPSKGAEFQTFHVSAIDSHDPPDDRDAPDKAQCSYRSGEDEHRYGVLDVLRFLRRFDS